ncbi:ras-related and estrogen-regulated growth inhibitor-like isoform X2 [Mya arenaria]|uniref:ras-related and estrogen-regulated growth inhibitor-like isoform X2 n=1 Tax=Mya arenaria TaxID=6604 RepID=UPI0022E0CCBB|nr:ras-related and estrogen-regulated growth inhibitor-like isoform X2 [Mya arenaria]
MQGRATGMNGVRGGSGTASGRLGVPKVPTDKDAHNVCKIVILGLPGVGKTESLHLCHCNVDGDETRIEILDTAGQMMVGSGWVWKDYYGFWGDCFLFVYSINDRNSFEQVVNFKRHVETSKLKPVCGLLVGNKSDLLHDRQVSENEAAELADDIGCRFYEVSAADWTQVDKIVDLFHDAVRENRKSRGLRDLRVRRPSSTVRFRQAIQKVITGKASTTKRTTQS